MYYELKRYENYLKKYCFTDVNKNSYQSFLMKNDVQFFVKSSNLQERLLSYHDIYDNTSIRDYIAEHFGVSSLLEGMRINNAYNHRVSRLKGRVYSILQSPCIFLTLTFSDYSLVSTSYITRRRYVQRFLKSYSSSYVANIDFGDEHEREHYHALINCSSICCDDWPYGIINFERVRLSSDITVLSKYIAKLTNHALKYNYRKSNLIYPKRKSKLP